MLFRPGQAEIVERALRQMGRTEKADAIRDEREGGEWLLRYLETPFRGGPTADRQRLRLRWSEL